MYQRPQSRMIWENTSSEQDRPGVPHSGLLYQAAGAYDRPPASPPWRVPSMKRWRKFRELLERWSHLVRAPGADRR